MTPKINVIDFDKKQCVIDNPSLPFVIIVIDGETYYLSYDIDHEIYIELWRKIHEKDTSFINSKCRVFNSFVSSPPFITFYTERDIIFWSYGKSSRSVLYSIGPFIIDIENTESLDDNLSETYLYADGRLETEYISSIELDNILSEIKNNVDFLLDSCVKDSYIDLNLSCEKIQVKEYGNDYIVGNYIIRSDGIICKLDNDIECIGEDVTVDITGSYKLIR